jgi:amino acid adenylation domain-containing protein
MQGRIIEGFRLSPHQRYLWGLQQSGPAFTARCEIALEGPICLDALNAALREVADRHEMLRTTFECLPGMNAPIQVINESTKVAFHNTDLSVFEPAAQATQLEAIVQKYEAIPFDFERGPIAHFCVITLAVDKCVLIIRLPAIYSDAWTLNNLVNEIRQAYCYCLEGQGELSEPLQYVQFSEWQNELLECEDGDEGQAHWRKLANLSRIGLALPFERNSSGHNGSQPELFTSRFIGVEFEPHLSETISALITNEESSGQAFFLMCWQVLLWRLTRQTDLVIHTVFDGRSFKELHGAVGLFARSLPINVSLSEDLQTIRLLRMVNRTISDAYAFQDHYPWESNGSSNSSKAARSEWPVMFEYERRPGVWTCGDLNWSIASQVVRSDRFKLKMSIIESGEVVSFQLHYDSDVYALADIRVLAEQYREVAKSAAMRLDATVADLNLIGENLQRQIICEWNRTQVSLPSDWLIHDLVDEQDERNSDVTALVYQGQQLTFKALNRRANQLAMRLRGLGVGPETLVGIVLDRSVEMVVAVLGVLKVGGAYLPLDPGQPKQRLTRMLDEARPLVVLTTSSLRARLDGQTAEVLCLDSQWETVAAHGAWPSERIGPGNLAYVIYTSGSSGRPKGVMISHRSLMNLAEALNESVYERAEEGMRVSVNAPLGFDASVKQIAQLAYGRTLVVVPEEVRADGEEMVKYVEAQNVEALDCTPSQLKLMLAGGMNERRGQGAVKVLVGGEAIDERLWGELGADEWRRYYNVYGPTECTVDASVKEVRGERATIGRPIGNVKMYILDERRRPVGIGETGEIYIGGEGLGRGYLKRAEMTAERYIPNEFSAEGGERLYQTGDLGRYRADGEIECLGRADKQVKVRGHRIELGEIEAALREHPMLEQAIASVWGRSGGEDGEKRIVAYVVMKKDGGAAAPPNGASVMDSLETRSSNEVGEGLLEHLRERLPEYMIPWTVMLLDEMPLTRNGKIDQEKLPEPDAASNQRAKRRPETEVEEVMSLIWEEVLKTGELGTEENFFDAGGHSLIATQLVSRVRKVFKVEIALRTLFEEPTVRALSRVVEREMRLGRYKEAPPIKREEGRRERELSYAQERLWFLEQLDPGNAVYNCPSVARIQGKLNESLLEDVIQEIVRRHEALRSSIATVNGRGVSIICAGAEVRIELVDLRGVKRGCVEQVGKRLALEEARRPFDLAGGPLLRVKLLKVEEEDQIILLTMHHIVSDGWSMGLFDREIRQLYAAYREGRPSPLDELSIHYGDYAEWQRSWLSGDVIEEQLGYWKKHLEGAQTVLVLPTDRPRPAVMRYPGASHHSRLPAGLSARLKELGRMEGATLFMTLMSVFQLLLHRYTGECGIIVGTPISGRNQFETESLIGLFINTLVIRTKLSEEINFRELLRYVRDITLEAHAHQDLPFEKLIEEIGVERSLSYNPLFQVMFVLENISNDSPELPGLKLCPFEVNSETQKFDLTLSAVDAAGEISISFLYNTDLFDASTIARMSGHFRALLDGMTSDPSRPLADLQLLTEAERQQMLVEWNDTVKTYDQRAVHELFEAQVKRAPDSIASVFEDQWVTYQELNGRANQLGQYLKRLGVGPEAPVGLCLERSIEMVVGIMGVLKSGGAYMPLDPAYPRERLAVILEDAQGPILLTQQRLAENLPGNRARIICLDADLEAMSGESPDDPAYHVTLDNACYVIYTSGSTGLPKGVVNTHRGLCHRLLWMQNAYCLSEDDRVLQKTPFTFDVSVWEFFWPLITGACLVIARPEGHRDSAYLARLMSEEGITTIHFVPSMLQVFLDEPDINNSRGLRNVICSGEALSLELQEKFFERMQCQLRNLYGPTEAAIDVTHWSCERHGDRKAAPPIGGPITNTSIYLLDDDFRPVPQGAHGELHIGGVGLARGYLRRPDLTSERFIPDPIGNEPGGRLYKTGDRARYRPDGVIEYLGRFDHQVKIRGFRIETGEIEAALSAHRGVGEVVVIAREDVPGDKQLAAYIVPKSASPPQEDELRNHVKESLPDFMVPSAFVFLESFPLTRNGKLDRKMLPPPVRGGRAAGEGFLPPRDNLEFQLTELWGDVLGVKDVGVRDDFFSLGGHSLMAVRLMARIREQYGRALPLSALFQDPTVERLASILRGQISPPPYSPLVEIRRGSSRSPFFCAHPVGGEVMCYVDLASRLAPGQPFYGLQARGRDCEEEPLTSVEEMASQYIQAMRAVQPAGPYQIGGWSFGGLLAFEMARQIREAGEIVGLLAIIDASAPRRDGDVPEIDDIEFMLDLLTQFISVSRNDFERLAPDEWFNYLLKRLKAESIVPPDFGPVEARFYFDMVKANRQAALKYVPRPYDGKVTLFRSSERSGFTDPTLGWGQLAEGGVEVHVVAGKHEEIVMRPHVQSLAEELMTSLNAIDQIGKSSLERPE